MFLRVGLVVNVKTVEFLRVGSVAKVKTIEFLGVGSVTKAKTIEFSRGFLSRVTNFIHFLCVLGAAVR